MPTLKFSDVFKPGTYPEHTYVDRISDDKMFSYEQRLNMALTLEGFLVCITGPSKTGKTVLCEKVIGLDNIVSLNGNDFEKSGNFWAAIAIKAGIPISGTQGATNTVDMHPESVMHTTTQNYVVNKDVVVRYFVDNNKVLVLDDFHYASDAMQYEAACQLKDVIRRNFKAVVISLPHRSDDPLRQNPDLNGRVQFIELSPWTNEELVQIPQKGFEKLNIAIDSHILQRMTLESSGSPQLMQYICFNIDIAAKQKHQSLIVVTEDLLILSCQITTINLDCKAIVEHIKAGPFSRGQKRIKYKLANGNEVDIYELLLYIIAENPPHVKLSLEYIKTRSDALIVGVGESPHVRKGLSPTKPNATKLKAALNKTQERLNSEKAFYNVIEWKDDSLYILESLFLFYVRWSNWKENRRI